jgi:hypothetical protein
MKEVIFNTFEEAEAQQALDLVEHLKVHNSEPYKTLTTRWATPRQRIDGKWAYECCEHQDYTVFLTEDFDPNNYQIEEE